MFLALDLENWSEEEVANENLFHLFDFNRAWSSRMQQVDPEYFVDLWTVSIRGPARLQASDVGYDAQGLSFTVVEGHATHRLQTGLVGQYNVSNLLGVLGAMRAVGVPLGAAVQACSALPPVPGRMDCLSLPGRPLVAVDYAHTPDALEKALEALRPLAMQRKGRLWVVFGCGGDRDAAKRPLMGAVAQQGKLATEQEPV